MQDKKVDGKTFVDSLENLRNAAEEISKQTTSLEDSLKLFDIGMKEAEFCKKILTDAEQKIEVYKDQSE